MVHRECNVMNEWLMVPLGACNDHSKGMCMTKVHQIHLSEFIMNKFKNI